MYQTRIEDERIKTMERQAKENSATEKTVNDSSKPCPKCTIRLDKFAGCNHVTCELFAVSLARATR